MASLYEFSPISHSIFLMSKHFSQHPDSKHREYVYKLLSAPTNAWNEQCDPQCERPGSTPTHNKRQNCSCMLFFTIFRLKPGRQKVLDWVLALDLPEHNYFTSRGALISNFRRVLNAVLCFLGNLPASELLVPTFRNFLSFPSS